MTELSKTRIKDLARLKLRKVRDEQSVFVAEGDKLVRELMYSFRCLEIVANEDWLSRYGNEASQVCGRVECADSGVMERISLLKTSREVFAVMQKPKWVNPQPVYKGLVVALDGVQDPGNVGTIIRTADWFGIENVICGNGCADVFSPKVVQSTMGALSRVKVYENVNLSKYLETCREAGLEIYGTELDGNDIYETELGCYGVIVMGSEGNGIGQEVRRTLTKEIKILSYPQGRQTSESLNVAQATAIICSEFRRRMK